MASELEDIRRAREAATAVEVERIERASDNAVVELRARCSGNMERAQQEVSRFISGEDKAAQ
jgi:uncharacterized protein YchJ